MVKNKIKFRRVGFLALCLAVSFICSYFCIYQCFMQFNCIFILVLRVLKLH